MSSPATPPILIKADRAGFTLIPDPGASLEAVMAFMDDRLGQSRDFFQNTEMVLDLRNRPMRSDEISALYTRLYQKSMVRVVEVRLSDHLSFSMAGEPKKSRAAVEADGESNDCVPVIVRNTCRSGVRVVSSSDCVVLGDVNPGAEIIAEGDVIIFGNLRGVAHAGARGDQSARIWALSFEPNQIRIADLMAVPPRGAKPARGRFEIAEIRDGVIQVVSL
ncbi:MAG: septum site-determining protein MinC [Deltaproteobacteria bacterium]|jgi:septum site-determining protein MinC|nr:septum site-determining protein MinC [Deltaproteobacteria bacterium]